MIQFEMSIPKNESIFGNVKLHGFHGNQLCDFRKWDESTKILISQQQLILEY